MAGHVSSRAVPRVASAARVREALVAAGRPLTLSEIVAALGPDAPSRESIGKLCAGLGAARTLAPLPDSRTRAAYWSLPGGAAP